MSDKQEFVARPLEGRAIYESHVDRYRKALADDFDNAADRYGFVFFHSMPARERVALANELGILRGDAVDEYNVASLAAAKEDYADAKKRLEKILKADPSFYPAAYQLAAVCERLGDDAKAREWGKKALALAPEDEKAFVEEQLATIGAAAAPAE